MWSTHVADQHLFSMFSLILTFYFGSILGSFFPFSFFTFWGPNGQFLGLMWGLKTVLGSTHIVKQLSFSMIPSTLIIDFDLILGPFFTFGGTNMAF